MHEPEREMIWWSQRVQNWMRTRVHLPTKFGRLFRMPLIIVPVMGQYRRKSCNQTTVSLIITSDHNRAKSEQVKIDEDWVGWSRIDQPRLSTYKSRQILRRPFFPLSHKVIGHYHSSVLLVISTGFVMCHAKPSIPHLFSVVPWVTVHWLVGPYETTPSPCFMVSHVKSTLNFKDMSIDKRALWAKWKCNKSVS